MTRHLLAAASLLLPLAAVPAAAQTERETKVKTDTKVNDDGVATTTRTRTTVAKTKTNQPKKILGVKVGNKTRETKTVRTTSVSSNGDSSTKVKTSH